jgi:hypothetical protein
LNEREKEKKKEKRDFSFLRRGRFHSKEGESIKMDLMVNLSIKRTIQWYQLGFVDFSHLLSVCVSLTLSLSLCLSLSVCLCLSHDLQKKKEEKKKKQTV